MSDGTMFAPLANYSRRPFAQEHKTILVRTEEGMRRLEVFAVDVLDADSEGVVAGFVTCSYQTDNSRTAVYAMEVE